MNPPLTHTCLAFLLRPDHLGLNEVLLGHKNLRFGAGKIAGLGGKVDGDEGATAAVVREVAEESGLVVDPADAVHCAAVAFRFPTRPAWDQLVDVFTIRRWSGQVIPSAEITPQWHPVDALPYRQMWDDATYWLPQVLSGQSLTATIVFADDCERVEKAVVEIGR